MRYFVAYVFSNGRGVGHGWSQVNRPTPIRAQHDLEEITGQIVRSNPGVTSLTITNWQRFES
jgi:hypothetical protein